jgi:putative transposase
MRDLGQRYVQSFNRRYSRIGTLWQGRFFASIAQSARYVIACYSYIERNPVDAKMVAKAADYPWSSYAANTGRRVDPLVTPHAEYLALGEVAESRHASYARLVDEKIDPSLVREIEEAERTGYPLASDAFKAELGAQLGRRTDPGQPGRPEKREDEQPDGQLEIGL